MKASEPYFFDCRIYVSATGALVPAVSHETRSSRTTTLMPVEYGSLIDPRFRRLMEAFEFLPRPLSIVQV